jgi:hypothetical protein
MAQAAPQFFFDKSDVDYLPQPQKKKVTYFVFKNTKKIFQKTIRAHKKKCGFSPSAPRPPPFHFHSLFARFF